MSVSKSVAVLVISALTGVLLAFIFHHLYLRASVPQKPCTSTITDGQYFDDNHQRYTFNGSISWWPDNHKITLNGVKQEQDHDAIIMRRTLTLNQVRQHNNVVSGRVAAVDISSADQSDSRQVMFSAKGEPMQIMFKKLNAKSWLLIMNDNWILMCSNK
ncbi:hypothetical protein N5923_20835 [Erwiniaceae bacterium BAC15a-03b]|uniref:Uncharacterized protein n=1 Tax=Winslowiella arboricola TaxID=2978220 RepID=A0A9J6PU02_9GAMM|nr:hypothetical protein [Winslowiella arboricola]MCU5774909.1 hypothetical protein [Winslowiella arboricola]MCU5779939.1 hypothetical protein [Winslowiella arboricola]